MAETLSRSHFDLIESIVDESNVQQLLLKLARICNEKAEHIKSNWQDGQTAKVWERAANRLATFAESKAIREVSL